MNLHDRTVEADRLNADPHELLLLQFLEKTIQHARLGPAIHARIDRVPVAKAFGQATPFAAVLSDIKNRVDDLQIGDTDVAPLDRKKWLDSSELRGIDFLEERPPGLAPCRAETWMAWRARPGGRVQCRSGRSCAVVRPESCPPSARCIGLRRSRTPPGQEPPFCGRQRPWEQRSGGRKL